jgi:hypothetical protein
MLRTETAGQGCGASFSWGSAKRYKASVDRRAGGGLQVRGGRYKPLLVTGRYWPLLACRYARRIWSEASTRASAARCAAWSPSPAHGSSACTAAARSRGVSTPASAASRGCTSAARTRRGTASSQSCRRTLATPRRLLRERGQEAAAAVCWPGKTARGTVLSCE